MGLFLSTIAKRPIIDAFDAATADAMATNKSLFEDSNDEIHDFDKDIFLYLTNLSLAKMGPQYGYFTPFEFDACIDYYEKIDLKWL